MYRGLLTVILPSLLLLAAAAPADAQNACSTCYQQTRPGCDRSCQGSSTRTGFSSCVNRCVAEGCSEYCRGAERAAAATPTPAPSAASGYTGPRAEPATGTAQRSGFGSAEEEDEDSTNCGACLREKQLGECQRDCSRENPADMSDCVRRCAKSRCTADCSLPGKIVPEAPPASRRDCAECKRVSKTACSQSCGSDTDRAGYMTCMVSCAEQRCMETCNPSSYE